MKKEEGLELLAKNMAAEADAVKEYLPLANLEQIREIISDELAHLLVLAGMLVEEGNFEIANDGVEEALTILKKHLTNSTEL